MAVCAVVFDLDQTLWRLEAPPDFDQITMLQAGLLEADFARLEIVGVDLQEFVRSFWANFPTWSKFDPEHPGMEEPRWLSGPGCIQRALSEYSLNCSEADGACIWEALNSLPMRHFNLRLFPDAAPTIEALSAAGYRHAVATSRPLSAEILARELQALGLPDAFETIVTAGELGYRKPHPLLFESTLRCLGLPSEEVVVVGDSYEDDIVPAAELGIVTILKLNDRRPDPSFALARYQVASLETLLELELFARSSKESRAGQIRRRR